MEEGESRIEKREGGGGGRREWNRRESERGRGWKREREE